MLNLNYHLSSELPENMQIKISFILFCEILIERSIFGRQSGLGFFSE